jgi:putative methionine-R-sulfoxide reductase with GAF domain
MNKVAGMATVCSSLKQLFPELIFNGFYVTERSKAGLYRCLIKALMQLIAALSSDVAL